MGLLLTSLQVKFLGLTLTVAALKVDIIGRFGYVSTITYNPIINPTENPYLYTCKTFYRCFRFR